MAIDKFEITSAQTPYFIPEDRIFTVQEYAQVFYSDDIEIDGELVIDGRLIQVGI